MRRFFLILGWAVLLVLGCGARQPAQAQFIGYTSQQTVQQTVVSNLDCLGGASQTVTVRNIGQSFHFVAYNPITTFSDPATSVEITIIGDGTPISDPGVNTNTRGVIFGYGYFPTVQVSIVCAGPVSLTVTYAGTSDSPGIIAGQTKQSVFVRQFITENLLTAVLTRRLQNTPFNSSGGALYLRTETLTNPATVTVECFSFADQTFGSGTIVGPVTIPAGAGPTFHRIAVPPWPCSDLEITIDPTPVVGNPTISAWYMFSQEMPERVGSQNSALQQSYELNFACDQQVVFSVTAGATTQVIALAAGQRIRICHVTFSAAAAATAQIVDGTGVNCATGPANVTAAHNVPALGNLSLHLGPEAALRSRVSNAICVAAAGNDVTGTMVFARF